MKRHFGNEEIRATSHLSYSLPEIKIIQRIIHVVQVLLSIIPNLRGTRELLRREESRPIVFTGTAGERFVAAGDGV